jgi:hypothetical protein
VIAENRHELVEALAKVSFVCVFWGDVMFTILDDLLQIFSEKLGDFLEIQCNYYFM